MDFGKIPHWRQVDFTLPPDHPQTQHLLSGKSVANPLVYVGCPIWACPQWIGTYYPTGTKDKDYLKHYAKQFNTIELNTTHYRIPDQETVKRWHDSTPEGFTFCPKLPQSISHDAMLRDTEAITALFCENIAILGTRLGTCFLQLPPHFSPHNAHLLENFVQQWPKQLPLAVEFRHQDWFTPKYIQASNEIFSLLEVLKIGTVITDVSGRRDVLHQRISTKTATIRFVGNGDLPSDFNRLNDWLTRLNNWLGAGMEQVYFFMHQPDNVLSPELASYFIEKIQKMQANIVLKSPQKVQEFKQGSLF